MKALILIFSLFFTTHSYGIDQSVFGESYPTYQFFQLTLLSQLRTYFETLPGYSIVYDSNNGVNSYNVKGKSANTFTLLFSKIDRKFQDKQIIERVSYFLENGNSIEVEVVKIGKDVIATPDSDLLSFKFSPSKHDEIYQMTIPSFKVQLIHTNLKNGFSDFLSMGFMDINIQIDGLFDSNKAQLDYIYFYKDMPHPQTSLSVIVFPDSTEWSGLRFFHSASAVGEITPAQFFNGLNEGAMVFVDASQIFQEHIFSLGFPKLD